MTEKQEEICAKCGLLEKYHPVKSLMPPPRVLCKKFTSDKRYNYEWCGKKVVDDKWGIVYAGVFFCSKKHLGKYAEANPIRLKKIKVIRE